MVDKWLYNTDCGRRSRKKISGLFHICTEARLASTSPFLYLCVTFLILCNNVNKIVVNTLSTDQKFKEELCVDRGQKPLTPILSLDDGKPCSFLNHSPHHTLGDEGSRTGSYWILFMSICACLLFCLSACVCAAPVSSSISLHSSTLHPKSNSLLWLTQIEHKNNSINPPLSPLTLYSYGLDYQICTSCRSDRTQPCNRKLSWQQRWLQLYSCLSQNNIFVLLTVLQCALLHISNQWKQQSQGSFTQIILPFYHNRSAFQSPVFSLRVVSIFTSSSAV